jgi:hypothetical protein
MGNAPSGWTNALTSVQEVSLSRRWSDGFVEDVTPDSAWSEPHWDFTLPPIEPGVVWNDSLQYRTVLGGIQVLYTAIRSGSVGQWEGNVADSTLAVTVEARVRWEGTGFHRVPFQVGGAGRSTSEFRIGRGGDLRSMVTSETLDGAVAGPGRDSLPVEVTRIDSVIVVR